MLKLRTILLYRWPYYVILCLSLLLMFIRITLPKESKYQGNETTVTGILIDKKIDGNELSITLKAKEQLTGKYYFTSLKEKEKVNKEYRLGDKVVVKGSLEKIQKTTTPHIFSYYEYAKRQGQFFTMKIEVIEKINTNKNIIYMIRNIISNRIEHFSKTNGYLKAFILGDTSSISKEIMTAHQENGISHLFAVSGMHISLLSGILLFFLKKIKVKENLRYVITILFLFFYLLVIGNSPSVIRATIFFSLCTINKIFYFYIKPVHLFFLTVSIVLLYQPFFIYEIGFQFSFLISFHLILFSEWLNKKSNYLLGLLKVSLLAFISSIPITIFHFSQINLLSIFYNLYFVPLVSMVIFPLSLLTFCCSYLEVVFHFFVVILEESSLFLSNISWSKVIMMKPTIIVVLLYMGLGILLFYFIETKKKIFISLYLLFFVFHYYYPNIIRPNEVIMLDIGQGDSILLNTENKTILIDTGGKLTYKQENWKQKQNNSYLVDYVTIPYLKAIGIRRIDYLILTHGDYDHMGEAIKLVENFKVEKVIFNCGKFNELEQDLIKVLDKKKIPYYPCVKELNIDDNKLYFLNNKIYDNENDNSSVIYTELNNHKFLFMGDAGVEVEEELVKKYNLQDIDILKVGHHGSKTSSSKNFIDEIEPKYSIISVGKNNRYGHPNKEVLNNLKESKIYRTDEDGSIMLKIKNNKLKIETCSP